MQLNLHSTSLALPFSIAHPDDETIGCGGLLTRPPGAQIVVVTNGSPADPLIARRKCFATADQAVALAVGSAARRIQSFRRPGGR